jgi:hypothetical protein
MVLTRARQNPRGPEYVQPSHPEKMNAVLSDIVIELGLAASFILTVIF